MNRVRLAALALVLLATASCSNNNSTAPTTPTTTATTRIVNITGDLAFGNVNLGDAPTRTYTISNSGNAALTVTGLQAVGGTGNTGFTATLLTGTIGPGSSSSGQLRFTPTAAQGYSHVLTVIGDQTSGNAAINVSGVGVGTAAAPAPAPAPTPGPSPTTFTVSGTVTDGFSGVALTRTQVQVTSGVNSGRSTGTDGGGNYSLTSMSAGTFTLSGSATGYQTVDRAVTLSSNTRFDFVLPRVASTPAPTPTPPPSSRVRIGAICNDGTLSDATGSGACSSHGGVRCWRYNDGTCTNP